MSTWVQILLSFVSAVVVVSIIQAVQLSVARRKRLEAARLELIEGLLKRLDHAEKRALGAETARLRSWEVSLASRTPQDMTRAEWRARHPQDAS